MRDIFLYEDQTYSLVVEVLDNTGYPADLSGKVFSVRFFNNAGSASNIIELSATSENPAIGLVNFTITTSHISTIKNASNIEYTCNENKIWTGLYDIIVNDFGSIDIKTVIATGYYSIGRIEDECV